LAQKIESGLDSDDIRPVIDPTTLLAQTLRKAYLDSHPNDPNRDHNAEQYASQLMTESDCRQHHRRGLHGS